MRNSIQTVDHPDIYFKMFIITSSSGCLAPSVVLVCMCHSFAESICQCVPCSLKLLSSLCSRLGLLLQSAWALHQSERNCHLCTFVTRLTESVKVSLNLSQQKNGSFSVSFPLSDHLAMASNWRISSVKCHLKCNAHRLSLFACFTKNSQLCYCSSFSVVFHPSNLYPIISCTCQFL